jgi:hypothetical protein
MDGITIAQLTTVAGLTTACTLLSFLFWHTANFAPATQDRFGPLSAVAIGVLTGVASGFLLDQGRLDLVQDGINGVMAGLASMGVYDLVKSKAGAA